MAWRRPTADTVWLFDLDNTLHDAGAWVFGALHRSMGDFTARALGLDLPDAQALNRHYWHRYGASLLGLMRHHGVQPAHFLADTHRLPGLDLLRDVRQQPGGLPAQRQLLLRNGREHGSRPHHDPQHPEHLQRPPGAVAQHAP